MDVKEFRKYAHIAADWMSDYYETIESRPVKSRLKPGEIFDKIPDLPPDSGETMDAIMKDVDQIILPGITHWQSPGFFAYFPANASYPSILAEMFTAALGAQCMIWETSPAAAELEEKVMEWLKVMTGIPSDFQGVIQDTASTSTLVALISAREKKSRFSINQRGFENRYTVYCSSEAHSSVEKAVKIAGFGSENLRKITVDSTLAMIPAKLENTIKKDIEDGKIPVCVVAAVGTTGTAAIDPVFDISLICKKYDVWLHIDAAYAGSAMILPEYRNLLTGINDADSYVFNPHKWMFTNFDCSAYFVRDKETLLKTFEIHPEYLKTATGKGVNNYRDWGIQLGRRFRALKLWFVIREMGVDGIKEKIANHIQWAREFSTLVKSEKHFLLHEPQNLALVCFRLNPENNTDTGSANRLNMDFLHHLNSTGKLYLSHTLVKDWIFLRMSIGQTQLTRDHVFRAWEFINKEALNFI